MPIDLIIYNGTLVLPEGIIKGDIAVDNGKIVAIGSSSAFPKSEKKLDASRKLVLPGAIDSHTHFELPFMGETPPETWAEGSIAALFGGTTTVVDFAIQQKGNTLMNAVKEKASRAKSLSTVDYSFHGCFTDFSNIESVKGEIRKALDYGISSFKEFMIYKKQGWQIEDWNLYLVLQEAKKLGALVGVHAESASIGESMIEQFVREGKVQAKFHPESKPNFVEAEAIQRAIFIARYVGARLYIVHMSTREGISLVKTARSEMAPVYSETCTHYLILTDDVYSRPDGINYILSPPLRKKEDIEALWNGLADGTIAIVGSDHVAYTTEQKKKHSKTFAEVPNGAGGVEVRLPILYSEGVTKGRLSLSRLVEVSCTNSAKLFGMYPRKGTITLGSDADLVILDPKLEKVLSVKNLHMGSDYTVFEGMKVKGYPIVTILRGKIMVKDGEFLGKKGSGNFIKTNIRDEIIHTV